ncbi:ParA family protein [Intrasporangium flavum]|uniref:ParA family protein n=1 Tax=Intrasporangium flavum TaxID=1428657 RepID=UPI003BFA2B75
MSTNLGWPSEPEPSPEHRRLGWLARMLGGVSRETGQGPGSGDTGGSGLGVGGGEAPEAAVVDATLVAGDGDAEIDTPGRTDVDRAEPDAVEALADADADGDHGRGDPGGARGSDAGPEVLSSEPAPVEEEPDGRDNASREPVDDDRTEASGPDDLTDDETDDEEERPVDNAVDDAPDNTLSTQEPGVPAAGDNVVDEEARRRAYADGHADREALVAALPTVDDDTPLARELADNARRRIQLTGRPFPKPAAPRVLTVANQKGGVGKTTTTVNVAAALAQSGLKVLVIDLDPQGNASTALGIDHHAEVPSIYDVLVDGTPLLDVVQPCTTVESLFCAPATIDLAGAEIELVSLVARETRLQKAIAAASEAGHSYDYILIDCPPSLGLLTVNAMVAASEVFIPIQCEYYALEGLSQLLKNIELVRAHLNPPLHVSTILLTMYDGRTRLSAQVAEEVREHFPEQVLRTTVPRSVRISEAPSFGETVMTYDSTSSGALAYLEAAGEMADRGAAGAA